MKKNFTKIFLSFFFFLVIWLSSIKESKAWVIVLYQDSCITPGLCNYSESCPACSSANSACCSGGEPWTKYNVTCQADYSIDTWGNYIYFITINVSYLSTEVCSTGDKINLNSTYIMNAGYCDCSVGGAYKACCNTTSGDLVTYTTYQADRSGTPLEAACGNGGTPIHSYSTYNAAYAACAAYNPCEATCYAPYTAGQTSCTGFNSGLTTYTAASGKCSNSTYLCCSITTATATCTTANAATVCNDNNTCTSDTCLNPGTASASCSNTDNGSCSGVPMYYCRTSDDTCNITSASYETQAACQTNLSTYLPGQTTGVCYYSSSSCNSVCNPIITPPPSTGCIPWDCPTISGSCGYADGGIYSSKPTSGLCSSGSSSYVSTSGGYYLWSCYGSIDYTATWP